MGKGSKALLAAGACLAFSSEEWKEIVAATECVTSCLQLDERRRLGFRGDANTSQMFFSEVVTPQSAITQSTRAREDSG